MAFQSDIDEYFAAERRLDQAMREMREARRAVVDQMNSSDREALAAVATFLHLQDGMRGANGACRTVVEALAPWAKELEPDVLFDLFVNEEDEDPAAPADTRVADERKGEGDGR